MNPESMVGGLSLRPGRQPAVTGGRPLLATALAVGQPAREVPERLARVFALCGDAHRLAAHLALAAAGGTVIAAEADDRACLRWSTLREQARRIAYDWPRLAALPPAVAAIGLAWLRTAPPWPGGPDWPGVDAWLTAGLGAPPAVWLQCHGEGHRVDGRTFVMDAPLPRLLAATAARLLDAGPDGGMSLRPSPAGARDVWLAALASAMAADADFCSRPRWAGMVPDTGPWSRLQSSPAAAGRTVVDRLWARLADLARLACADGASWLQAGALPLGAREGLGWCEMARGLLLHRLRLDVDGRRVDDYRVLAPTEWNFHPDGTFARRLASWPDTAPDAAIGALVAAFDPCIGFTIVRTEATAHA